MVLIFFYIYLCVRMYVSMCFTCVHLCEGVPQYTCGVKRTISRSYSSPTICVLGTQLRSQVWQQVLLTNCATSVTLEMR